MKKTAGAEERKICNSSHICTSFSHGRFEHFSPCIQQRDNLDNAQSQAKFSLVDIEIQILIAYFMVKLLDAKNSSTFC